MNDHITLNGGTLIKDSTLIGATFINNNNFAHTPAETPQAAQPTIEIEEAEEVTDPADENAEEPPAETMEDKIRHAIRTMREENLLKKQYDYLWLMLALSNEKDLPHFDTPKGFLQYLHTNIGLEELPSTSSLQKKYGETRGYFPNWTFHDTDDTLEVNRRINVGKRFLSLLRKG